MKMHTKEILKNKADKMVDLIIDEIGNQGEKRLTTSFQDKKDKDTKYILEVTIKSGSPDIIDLIDDDELPQTVENILERLAVLEAKEDQDTIYDDTDIKERLTFLENKVDQDTIYDDSGIKARLTVLENKRDKDTIYDDTLIRQMIGEVDVANDGSLQEQINALKD